jgi:hypothetical protein
MIKLIKKYWCLIVILVELIALGIIQNRTGIYTQWICKGLINSGIGIS